MKTFGRFDAEQANMTKYERRINTPIDALQINEEFLVESPEGTLLGHPGDYLCKGIMGEHYICAKAIFEKLYRPLGV